MTLAAPKSRQGKFILVLAFLAAAIAVLAVFSWATSARANIDSGAAAITQDISGAPVSEGTPITYTVALTGVVSSAPLPGGLLVADFDDGLVFVSADGAGIWAGDCANGANNVVTCGDGLSVQNETVTVAFLAGPPGTISVPTCTVSDDSGVGTFNCTTAITAVTVGDAVIRHHDDADEGTEDAAGVDLDAYCTDQGFPCGILAAQDDSDDAVGSFHEACIIYASADGNALSDADNADITWNIAPGPGSSATVNPNPNGVNVSGPNGEPCVRWGSAGTGSQTITATYDNGTDPATMFNWDAIIPLPLVKQWNDIDATRIVASDDLGVWVNRNCSLDPEVPTGSGYCNAANVDGLTISVPGTQIPTIPAGGILISADPTSFIEFVTGSHSDLGGSYDGPIDGVSQTYDVSGDCGSVRIEDTANGGTVLLTPGQSVSMLSSDKGVGITFYTNTDGVPVTTGTNGNCLPDDEICVDVTDTIEANLFDSGPLQEAADESICVHFDAELGHVSKTPTLAWAGQRVVLSHDWSDVSDCDGTYVLYSVQAGPGSFTAALQGVSFNASQTGQDAIVQVDAACESHVIFENQDQAQNDIIAYVVDGPDLSTATPLSQQVPFVIYYLKFEDAVLTLVPGDRDGHNDGDFDADSDIFDSSGDVDSMSDVNVSADVLARLRVRGWVTTTNCPVRDSGTGANGEFLPANRCIFPDDWRFKAGGGVGDSLNDPATSAGFAEESRPDFDLDGSGVINAWDAPMPPALASFELSGSGFLRPADKSDIYDPSTNNNPNYSQRIPASDLIAPINADLSGYQWDGIYNFWTDLADHGAEVWSCAGPSVDAHAASDCGDPAKAVPTGGYHGIKIYTDNHGEAMTFINGDASLDFSDCTSSAAAAGHMIVLLSGYYCEEGANMGSSTLSTSVDYPDKRKHFAIQTNDVTIQK